MEAANKCTIIIAQSLNTIQKLQNPELTHPLWVESLLLELKQSLTNALHILSDEMI